MSLRHAIRLIVWLAAGEVLDGQPYEAFMHRFRVDTAMRHEHYANALMYCREDQLSTLKAAVTIVEDAVAIGRAS